MGVFFPPSFCLYPSQQLHTFNPPLKLFSFILSGGNFLFQNCISFNQTSALNLNFPYAKMKNIFQDNECKVLREKVLIL